MKKMAIIIISFAIIFISAFFLLIKWELGHRIYIDDFGEEGSSTDIKMLTGLLTEEDPTKNNDNVLKYAQIYNNIASDNSYAANRKIGYIERVPITAKMIELEALKFQAEGYVNVYTKAWEQLKIVTKENLYAKKYGIDCDEKAYAITTQTKNLMEEENNPAVLKYFNDLYNAFGMTKDEYWYKHTLALNKRLILHDEVDKYLKDNNLPLIDSENIDCKMTDDKYIEKINEESYNGPVN